MEFNLIIIILAISFGFFVQTIAEFGAGLYSVTFK
jgi:hypothetical protein